MPIKHPFTLSTSSSLIFHGQLKDALGAYGNPQMKISRMLAAGELISLRRGLYLRDRTVNPPALGPLIYGPSYVSFETALAWHGLIPERVETVVCATTRRPCEFETAVGRFRYRRVPLSVYPIGIERVDDPALPWLLASPTKALCDCIALASDIRSQKDVRSWLESMRVDELPELDLDQLAACAEHYHRTSVGHLARYLPKNMRTP